MLGFGRQRTSTSSAATRTRLAAEHLQHLQHLLLDGFLLAQPRSFQDLVTDLAEGLHIGALITHVFRLVAHHEKAAEQIFVGAEKTGGVRRQVFVGLLGDWPTGLRPALGGLALGHECS